MTFEQFSVYDPSTGTGNPENGSPKIIGFQTNQFCKFPENSKH